MIDATTNTVVDTIDIDVPNEYVWNDEVGNMVIDTTTNAIVGSFATDQTSSGGSV